MKFFITFFRLQILLHINASITMYKRERERKKMSSIIKNEIEFF